MKPHDIPGQEVVCQFSVKTMNDAAGMTYINNAALKGTDGKNVFVKSPEITILSGDDGNNPFLPYSSIHYALFSGHGDSQGNPLHLWEPDGNIKLEHMCIASYRLMTDNFKNELGNGTHTVPDSVTNRGARFFLSHGVITASEYTAGAPATQSQIYRILSFATKANLTSNSSNPMKRIDVASLICDLTKRDKSSNSNGLVYMYFTDKGQHASIIDEVSNSHKYTLDSAGHETWQSVF